MTVTGYITQPIVITVWTPYVTSSSIDLRTTYPERSYRHLKKYCPPPPPTELVALPMDDAVPSEFPTITVWLRRTAHTPTRERRPIRNRVERKDATCRPTL
jgi:hypothetical protein